MTRPADDRRRPRRLGRVAAAGLGIPLAAALLSGCAAAPLMEDFLIEGYGRVPPDATGPTMSETPPTEPPATAPATEPPGTEPPATGPSAPAPPATDPPA